MARPRLLFASIIVAAFIAPLATVRAQDVLDSSGAVDVLSEAGRERLYSQLQSEIEEFERQAKIVRLVVKLTSPTVVHIETEKIEGRRASSNRRLVEEAGSGVVIQINKAFYVLTNFHVIKDADLAKIAIELADGRTVRPTRVASDPLTDVAVLSIAATGLVPARLGDSSTVDIGDFVLAVGSPFGLSRSITYGIVSAKGRRDLELGAEDVKFQDFIQTDAAINPGNSGGPLINMRGEVIGINTAIASNSGGNEGIGFSIPVNMVMAVARQLIERGSVVRAFIGVGLDPKYGADDAARIGLARPIGALVNRIVDRSPAQAANLQPGDVILKFGGIAVEDDAHLTNLVSLTEVGREVPIVIQRGRQQMTLSIRLADSNQLKPTKATPAILQSSD